METKLKLYQTISVLHSGIIQRNYIGATYNIQRKIEENYIIQNKMSQNYKKLQIGQEC